MTDSEFDTLRAVIKAAYPNHTIMPDKYSIRTWYTMLSDIDYEVAQNALMKYISLNKFPPSISEIRRYSAEITQKPVLSYSEAWSTVRDAVGKYGVSGFHEASMALDELTLACVRDLGWNEICMSENQDTIRANFRMAYEARAEKAKENNALPEFVRQKALTLKQQYISAEKPRPALRDRKESEKPKVTPEEMKIFIQQMKESIKKGADENETE